MASKATGGKASSPRGISTIFQSYKKIKATDAEMKDQVGCCYFIPTHTSWPCVAGALWLAAFSLFFDLVNPICVHRWVSGSSSPAVLALARAKDDEDCDVDEEAAAEEEEEDEDEPDDDDVGEDVPKPKALTYEEKLRKYTPSKAQMDSGAQLTAALHFPRQLTKLTQASKQVTLHLGLPIAKAIVASTKGPCL